MDDSERNIRRETKRRKERERERVSAESFTVSEYRSPDREKNTFQPTTQQN